MMNAELLNELRMIIKEDYGVELSPQALEELANTLLRFFETLAKIEYGGNV